MVDMPPLHSPAAEHLRFKPERQPAAVIIASTPYVHAFRIRRRHPSLLRPVAACPKKACKSPLNSLRRPHHISASFLQSWRNPYELLVAFHLRFPSVESRPPTLEFPLKPEASEEFVVERSLRHAFLSMRGQIHEMVGDMHGSKR